MIALHSDTAGRGIPVLFRAVDAVPREFTAPGGIAHRLTPIGRAAVRARLEAGPSLAVFDRGLVAGAFTSAFDVGIGDVRDIAGQRDRAHLIQIRDDELLETIDRDRVLRRRVA